jgi:nucleolar protein 56
VTDDTPTDAAWFGGLDPGNAAAAATAIRGGSADEPRNWLAAAVEAIFAGDDAE